MKLFFSRVAIACSIFIGSANAQVISVDSTEVSFTYSAAFQFDPTEGDAWTQTQLHHSYMFGVMHSPELAEQHGINSILVQGMGAPRSDVQIIVRNVTETIEGTIVSYQARGKMLLHNRVANKALNSGEFRLPMPIDLNRIYMKKCTDSYYSDVGDYWYFWNPFRDGCDALQREPYSEIVTIEIEPTRERKIEQTPRLDLVRGANANGDLFSIFVAHGFAGTSRDPKDDARENVKVLREYLLNRGFTEEVVRTGLTMPLSIFRNELTLPSGRTVQVEIKSLLVNTAIESRNVTFPRFFKEAVETADVIYYAGHSGLGGNLDIKALEDKAGGKFKFPKNKRQIFFFDSCSSYSYYLVPFSEKKTRARIDIITNALASYFHTGGIVLSAFLDILLDEEIEDIKWIDALDYIGQELEGESYLMSVGGV